MNLYIAGFNIFTLLKSAKSQPMGMCDQLPKKEK